MWSNGQNSNSIDIGEESDYWLIASNDKCSSDTAYISVDNSSVEIFSDFDFSFNYSFLNNELKIKMSQAGIYHIEIFTLNGQKIHSTEIHNLEYKFQFNYSGFIIVSISNNNIKQIKKLFTL